MCLDCDKASLVKISVWSWKILLLMNAARVPAGSNQRGARCSRLSVSASAPASPLAYSPLNINETFTSYWHNSLNSFFSEKWLTYWWQVENKVLLYWGCGTSTGYTLKRDMNHGNDNLCSYMITCGGETFQAITSSKTNILSVWNLTLPLAQRTWAMIWYKDVMTPSV